MQNDAKAYIRTRYKKFRLASGNDLETYSLRKSAFRRFLASGKIMHQNTYCTDGQLNYLILPKSATPVCFSIRRRTPNNTA
jgi:hypothetical protein